MKKLLLIAITLFIALYTGCTHTNSIKSSNLANFTKSRIAKEIEEIINTTDSNVNVGIKIVSLMSNDVVFEKNPSRHFIPASTIKLFTLAAALHYLGPSFRFTTALLTDGLIDKTGAIENLYIQGSGDPSLMDQDLISLVYELKQIGIKSIKGNIYIDDEIFDDVLWTHGAMWDDRHRGYSAPVCGLNLNYNRLQIKTVPSLSIGQTVHAIVKPATSFIQIIPEALTKNGGMDRQLSISVEHDKVLQEWPSNNNDGLHKGDKVFVKGHTAKNADPHYHTLAVNDPGILAGTFLKDELSRSGIKVKGMVLRKTTPSQALRLTAHESRSLAEALIDFTKISNNVANDALVKVIAAEAGVKPATFSAGLKLIQDFLVKEVGFQPNSLIAADGAGVSRYNLVTPEQMVKLLSYAAHHFHMAPEFMSALPIGGEDGLLRRRLTSDRMRGNVRAKTGTLSGISGLAGYLTGVNGDRYVFAVYVNGFIGSSLKYTRMQDQILATVLSDGDAKLANVK